MLYETYHFLGMHLVGWFILVGLLIWIFVLPYDIPGQRSRKDSPFDILKKRFESKAIRLEQYFEKKSILKKQ